MGSAILEGQQQISVNGPKCYQDAMRSEVMMKKAVYILAKSFILLFVIFVLFLPFLFNLADINFFIPADYGLVLFSLLIITVFDILEPLYFKEFSQNKIVKFLDTSTKWLEIALLIACGMNTLS